MVLPPRVRPPARTWVKNADDGALPALNEASGTTWPKKAGEFKGDVKKWTKSVWGDDGGGGGLGAGDSIYYKEEEIELDVLLEAFKKKPPPEVAPGGGPAKKLSKGAKIKLLVEPDGAGFKSTKRVETADRILKAIGDVDTILHTIVTCNVLENYTKNVLNPPGSDGAREMLENILKNFFPTEEEAAILSDYDGRTEDLGAGERFMHTLATYPLMKKRMIAIGSAVERKQKLNETEQAAQEFTTVWRSTQNSSVLQNLLGRLLRGVNALRQGRGPGPAAKPLSALKMFAANTAGSGDNKKRELTEIERAWIYREREERGLGKLIVEGLYGRSYTEGRTFYELFLNQWRPNKGLPPWDDKGGGAFDGGNSDWYAEQALELQASATQLKLSEDVVNADYASWSTTKNKDRLIFAWRMSVLLTGRAEADKNVLALKAAGTLDDEAARVLQDLQGRTYSADGFGNTTESARRQVENATTRMNQAKDSSVLVVQWAGEDLKSPDGQDMAVGAQVKKATEILFTIVSFLKYVDNTITDLSKQRGEIAQLVKDVKPAGVLYVPDLSGQQSKRSDKIYAERAESRLLAPVLELLDNTPADRTPLKGHSAPTLLHALQSLALSRLQ